MELSDVSNITVWVTNEDIDKIEKRLFAIQDLYNNIKLSAATKGDALAHIEYITELDGLCLKLGNLMSMNNGYKNYYTAMIETVLVKKRQYMEGFGDVKKMSGVAAEAKVKQESMEQKTQKIYYENLYDRAKMLYNQANSMRFTLFERNKIINDNH